MGRYRGPKKHYPLDNGKPSGSGDGPKWCGSIHYWVRRLCGLFFPVKGEANQGKYHRNWRPLRSHFKASSSEDGEPMELEYRWDWANLLNMDTLVVTHPTTSQLACGLSTAERTGSSVFHTLWSYVADIAKKQVIFGLLCVWRKEVRRKKNKNKNGRICWWSPNY